MAGLQTVPLVPADGLRNKNKPVNVVLICQISQDEVFITSTTRGIS